MTSSTRHMLEAFLFFGCMAAACGGGQAGDPAAESGGGGAEGGGEGGELTAAELAQAEAEDRAALIETLLAQGHIFVKSRSGCVRFDVDDEVPNLIEASDAADAPSFYVYRTLFGEYNLEYWSAQFRGSTLELTGPTRALVTASGQQRVAEAEGVTTYPLPTLYADHVSFAPEGATYADDIDPATLRVFWFEASTCNADAESAMVMHL